MVKVKSQKRRKWNSKKVTVKKNQRRKRLLMIVEAQRILTELKAKSR